MSATHNRSWLVASFALLVIATGACRLALGAGRVGDAVGGQSAAPDPAWLIHNSVVSAVALSPDGKTLAAGCEDQKVHLWDVATGVELRQLTGHKDGVKAVSFSPDNKRLASAGWDGAMRIWDIAAGRELHCCTGHKQGISAVEFSPDGRLLASGSADRTVRLWDAATGRETRTLTGHEGFVVSVAFAPDGRRLVSGGTDQTVRIWNLNDGKEEHCIATRQGAIFGVACSPDGRLLATGSQQGLVGFWSMHTGTALLQAEPSVNEPFRAPVLGVAFAPNGQTVASVDEQGNIRLWEAATGQWIGDLGKHGARAKTVAFAANGKAFATGGNDQRALLWRGALCPPELRPRPEPLTHADVNEAWLDLGLWDSVLAHRAIWRLVSARNQVVPLLQDKLHPQKPIDPQTITRLIADLDSDQFLVRQKATTELQEIGELAAPALARARAVPASLEVRQRVRWLLDKLVYHHLSSRELRTTRIVYVLEQVDTASARRLLAELAKGDPDARCTRLAQLALRRSANQPAEER